MYVPSLWRPVTFGDRATQEERMYLSNSLVENKEREKGKVPGAPRALELMRLELKLLHPMHTINEDIHCYKKAFWVPKWSEVSSLYFGWTTFFPYWLLFNFFYSSKNPFNEVFTSIFLYYKMREKCTWYYKIFFT